MKKIIAQIQNGLLEPYKHLDSFDFNVCSYKAIWDSFAKYYSIFDDGIQKFSMELNGVVLQTPDEDLNVTNNL